MKRSTSCLVRFGRGLLGVSVGLLTAGFGGCSDGSSRATTTVLPSSSESTEASPTTTAPISLEDLVARVRTGVIRIETENCDGSGVGTGFLLSPRLIATVEHVVGDAIAIRVKHGKADLGKATVIGTDPVRDLALLRLRQPVDGYTFDLAASRPRLGQRVIALGYPLGLPLTVTQGSVSGLNRTVPVEDIERRRLVQTDAAINPGNSGGPLIEADTGDVVGLVDAGSDTAHGIGFAVSAAVAKPLLEAWRLAPQPIPASTCQGTIPEEEPSASPSAPVRLKTFVGGRLSIDYPVGWIVADAERWTGSYFDTTIKNPDDSAQLIRVDLEPRAGPNDPEDAARQVEAALAKQPGYERIAYERISFLGIYDAIYWEFLVDEAGQLLHKVDVFFVDDFGQGVAVLTQSRSQSAGASRSTYKAIRASVLTFAGD
jgi:Trypsin-like peptidase domain